MCSNLDYNDPNEILELCASLHDTDCSNQQIKINKYLKEKTGSKGVFIVPLLKKTQEAVVQVIDDQRLARILRFPVATNVFNHAVHRRSSIPASLDDLDSDLKQMLSTLIDPAPNNVLNVPVPHPELNTVALIVCLINYPAQEHSDFYCSQLVLGCLKFCLGAILSTLAYQEEQRLKEQCENLLSVARNIFSRLGDLTDLLREIMNEARKLTNADRCSIFLLDRATNELVGKVFDGDPVNEFKEIRIHRSQGIAGCVASSGKILNIRNVYAHPLFYKGVDEATGYTTKNLLCFPIRDKNEVIGVAELCNKLGGYHFDVFDEEVALAFSIYCGISIMHSIIYKKIKDSQIRNQVSNELMMYHMRVSEEDVKSISISSDGISNEFNDFMFSPRVLSCDQTPSLIIEMFDKLGLIKRFNIKNQTLIRFILFVKKGYRDTPYHNWTHAFTVTHFAYLLILNLDLAKNGFLTDLECLALMVSCMCHDIDHRGTTNTFQLKTSSVLASLYSSEGSVMERHHLSQTLCILNTDNCNILEGLTRNEYTECLDLIKHCILATDLANHFKIYDEQKTIIENGYNKNQSKHRLLLLALLMNCCDLNDQVKDWKIVKKASQLIYDEFFYEGDLEKSMGNHPTEMMDRDKAHIPDLQINFINSVAMPVFELLEKLFPELNILVEAAKTNREYWKKSVDIFSRRWHKGQSSMDILSETELDQIVLDDS